MDELDLLKKDWNSQQGNYPKLSYDQIYKMIWRRSHSIVKWIFYISLVEFIFWAILNIFLADEEYWSEMERLDLTEFTIIIYIVNYIIVAYFIFNFYRNYRKISVTDDAATLMKNIIKTRKTVKYYIGYVLISTAVTTLVYTYFMINDHTVTSEVQKVAEYEFGIYEWLKFAGILLLFFAVLIGALWLFYRLIYGILLKRLHKNYKELKKLEM